MGTLSTGPLTLGGTLACRLSGNGCDRLAVTGNLEFLPGATLELTNLDLAPGKSSYLLATCTGNLTGPLPVVVGMPPAYTLDASAGQVRIINPYAVWATQRGLAGDPNNSGDDSDHDGESNLLEFATGGNPMDPADKGVRNTTVLDLDGGKTISFTVATRSGAVFHETPEGPCEATIDGIVYRIEGSNDITRWNLPVLMSPAPADLPMAVAGYEFHVFHTSPPAGTATRAFIRLSISVP